MCKDDIIKTIGDFVKELLIQESRPLPPALNESTVLFGTDGLLDSMLLVELMLKVEDYCEENGISFSWTSDAAMSEKNSIYKTIGTLGNFVASLSEQR